MSSLVLALLSAACSETEPPVLAAERWHAADRLLDSDNLWVGADGAYSIALGSERVLWLFGDTWIAKTPGSREGAFFIRNSVALQTGLDPSRAFIEFVHRQDGGVPLSFAAERDGLWLWPAHGARIGDRLLLFYELVGEPSDCDAPEWCFEGRGWTAFVVDDPDRSPREWQLVPAKLPDGGPADIQLGEAVLVEEPWLYVYATRGGTHSVHLARFELEKAAAGDLTQPEWYSDGAFRAGVTPSPLFSIGAPEFSVHFEPALESYLMVQSAGVGPTTLAARAAPRPEGPWSDPRDFMRPPESFDPDANVYAGKAHPELRGAPLVVTYVPGDVYYPRFVKAWVP